MSPNSYGSVSSPLANEIPIVPVLACLFALIVSPLLLYFSSSPTSELGTMEIRHENKFVWPILAAMAVVFAVRGASQGNRLYLPANIAILLAFVALAGLSVLWAFSPAITLKRALLQTMVVASIILPIPFAARTMDYMRGLYLCFATATIINVVFVFADGSQTIIGTKLAQGYSGYFQVKNYLGMCSAVAFLLALHELLCARRGRILALVLVCLAFWLMMISQSKTSLGLSLICPGIAFLMLATRLKLRISPVLFVALVIGCYLVISYLTGVTTNRLAFYIYGDSSFTGRQIIWDFLSYESARKPYLGWGYQSYWLVGPNGPSVLNAPGWVKLMPNGHNGYYDIMVELGYAGLILLIVFIALTLQAIGNVAKENPARAWLLLSIAMFIIIYNGLESLWFRSFEFIWLAFLMVAADAAQYGRTSNQTTFRRARVSGNVRPPNLRPRSIGRRHAAEASET